MQYLVTVHFGSSGSGITVAGEEVEVWVKSPPRQGRANRELVAKLAAHFGVPEASVRITSGFASRKKIVEIKQA